eukprot:1139793-Pelagomonas_calceolata.AAC.5
MPVLYSMPASSLLVYLSNTHVLCSPSKENKSLCKPVLAACMKGRFPKCKLARASPRRLTGPAQTKLGAVGKQSMRAWPLILYPISVPGFAPKYLMCSLAPFCLHGLTLKVGQDTWNDDVSPTCEFCDAQDDLQDKHHALFKCIHSQAVPYLSSTLVNFPHTIYNPLTCQQSVVLAEGLLYF